MTDLSPITFLIAPPKVRRAIANYGIETILEALDKHRQGNDARTVGFELGLTTRQADAAIDAARWLTPWTHR